MQLRKEQLFHEKLLKNIRKRKHRKNFYEILYKVHNDEYKNTLQIKDDFIYRLNLVRDKKEISD